MGYLATNTKILVLYCTFIQYYTTLFLKTNQTNRFNLIVAAAHAFGQCIEGSKGHGKSDGGDGTLRRHAKEARTHPCVLRCVCSFSNSPACVANMCISYDGVRQPFVLGNKN